MTDNTQAPGAAAGLVVTIAVAGLAVFAFNAVTEPAHVSIVGYVTGPCDVAPSSTVDVYADGELAGSGVIGVGNWAETCQGTITVGDVAAADEYTVDAGPLSAWISADTVSDAMTITLEAE